MTSLLSVQGLVKRFRGVSASDGIDLEIHEGEIHAIIGPNGAGKTTLINQLSGEVFSDAGRVVLDGVDITREPVHRRAAMGLARSYQITAVFDELTVSENVMLAVQARSGPSFRFWGDPRKEPKLMEGTREAIGMAGLDAVADRPAAQLAHGAKRQLELAIALAMKPKLLLLDEPMAGTGASESREIVRLLDALRASHTVLLIEHDLEAVFALADRISVLVYGKVIATGTAGEIRANPAVREAYMGDEELES